jgi:membrane peptidoglycan carboxypeptidase
MNTKTRIMSTLLEALQNSWNIPAVWLLNETLDTGSGICPAGRIPLSKETTP